MLIVLFKNGKRIQANVFVKKYRLALNDHKFMTG